MTWTDGSDVALEFEAPPFRVDRYYVYLVWGDDRTRPLYVGKANRPFTRAAHHLAEAFWASDIRSFECHGFATSQDALDAELEAIHELDPIHNKIRWAPWSVTLAHIEEVRRERERRAG